MEVPEMDFFNTLPKEVFHYMLIWFSPSSFGAISATNKTFRASCTAKEVWKTLCGSHFRLTEAEQRVSLLPINWQKEYQTMVSKSSHIFKNFVVADKDIVTLDAYGLHATYTAQMDIDKDAADAPTNVVRPSLICVLQAKYPMYPLPLAKCNMGYFEVTILECGETCGIGIGLAGLGYTNAMPGWRKGSYGWHGDDGKLYFEVDVIGRMCSTKWVMGDTIGCGVNFETSEIFFTRNGEFVTSSKINPSYIGLLYPTIGMFKSNDKVEIKFSPSFEFNMLKYQSDLFNRSRTSVFTPFSQTSLRVHEARTIFSKRDLIDDARLAASYGVSFEQETTSPAHQLKEMFTRLSDRRYSDEDLRNYMDSAKQLLTNGHNQHELRQNVPVLFEDNPDLAALRAALNQFAWTGAIHSCLFEIRQFRESMKEKAAKEGLAPEEDEVLEEVTMALIVLDYDPDNVIVRFNLDSIREEHGRDEAWPDDAGEPTIADLARFALFRAHNHMVDLFKQQKRLGRMKKVLLEEKKGTSERIQSSDSGEVVEDEASDEQGAGGHRIFPNKPQPDIGYYLRIIEILYNEDEFDDEHEIVLGIMWREYLIDCLMELDITQEPAALRASFIKYFENKVQMLIDMLETDPTIQSKVEALYINMSDAVPLLEDTSVPNGDADVLNACNIVLSSYGQLYPESLRENQPDLPNQEDIISHERQICLKLLKRQRKMYEDELMKRSKWWVKRHGSFMQSALSLPTYPIARIAAISTAAGFAIGAAAILYLTRRKKE